MSTSHPPPQAELPPPAIEEVSPGIFAYIQLDGSWFLNNAGFIVGQSSAVAIDTAGTEKRARAFHAAIRRTTPNPVQALVNTHSHADHTHGNFLFAPATAIVGHERCREEVRHGNLAMLSAAFPTADFGDVTYVPPMLTFTDRMNLYVDDLKVELIHVGPAHTTNDIVAWIPERRLLFAGDLVFNGGTPFAMGGSVEGWIEAIAVLRHLGAETIVPGHGAVCGPDAFDTVEAYLWFVHDLARNGLEAGATPLDLARGTDLGRFGELLDPERIVGNLHRAYSELQGHPRGAPLNAAQVIGEMVEYNGGAPLRCLA